MSRYLAAYFAIVGTLAFALGHFAAYLAIVTLAFAPAGAASGGQVNIPHINIPRPQISVPTPRLSSPKLTTPNLVRVPKVTVPVSGSKGIAPNKDLVNTGASSPSGYSTIQNIIPPTQTGGSKFSTSGGASATPVSNTGGGSLSSSAGASSPSGYSTVGKANASQSFRCRSKGGVSNCP
jgi:hypothetical protein